MLRSHTARRTLSAALALAAGLAVVACETTQLASSDAEAPAIEPARTDGGADASGKSEIQRILEQNALVLPSLASGELNFEEPAPPAPLGPPTPGKAIATRPAPEPETAAEEPVVPFVAASPGPAAAPPEPADMRRRREARALATELAERARTENHPFRTYLAAAALEALAPVIAGAPDPAELEPILPDPRLILELSPREQDALTIWRDMHRAMTDETVEPATRASLLTGVVSVAAERMAAWASLAIARVELCTRVDGYGSFETMGTPTLLAGRPHRAIVYVELDNFSTRPQTHSGVQGYQVELAQEVSVFHDADGVLAWRKPEETVVDFSRNRRRDFYTVQMIELPETLTVGAYRIKVSVRDKATGSIAEAVIPFELVADPKLVKVGE